MPQDNPLQICLVMDKTGSMGRMIDAAKKSLTKAIDGAGESSQGPKELSVICYEDYPQLSQLGTRNLLYLSDELDLSRKPIFVSDTTRAKTFLNGMQAQGGGDIAEMLEAALALATILPWNTDGRSVQTIYLALDAPPHAHLKNKTLCYSDNFSTAEAISRAQRDNLFPQIPCLRNTKHSEDWLTQCIILAKTGIVINPIICTTDDIGLIHLATFIALLTGGTPVFLPSSQNFENFGRYIQENTRLDFAELNNPDEAEFNRIQAQRDALRVSCELSFPSTNIIQAAGKLTSIIRKMGLIDPTKQTDEYESAERIRSIYEDYAQGNYSNLSSKVEQEEEKEQQVRLMLVSKASEERAVLTAEFTKGPWLLKNLFPFANEAGNDEFPRVGRQRNLRLRENPDDSRYSSDLEASTDAAPHAATAVAHVDLRSSDYSELRLFANARASALDARNRSSHQDYRKTEPHNPCKRT